MKISRILVFLAVLVVLALFSIYYPKIQGSIGITSQTTQNFYEKETAILLRVIDGDTIEAGINGNKEQIRLLGINTPEKNMPFSNDSKAFLRQFENKTISLLRDYEDTDKYKRKLRYLFYDNRLLNLEILENGFANAYYTSGLKYEKELLRAEAQARELGAGIWAKSNEPCAIQNCIVLKELNCTGEYFTIKNECNSDCSLDGWFVKDAGRNTFYLSNMPAHAEKIYPSPEGKDIWNNNGDQFFIFDKKGFIALYYSY